MEQEEIILVDAEEQDENPEKQGDENNDPAANPGKTEAKQEDNDERTKLLNNIKNLDKATNEELKEIYKAKQEALRGKREERKSIRQKLIEKIDTEDESAQAWTAKIEDEIAPVKQELDQQKQEIFDDMFLEFASDHPMSKHMAERVINTYTKVANSSGLSPKAVLRDIAKAFAAESVEEQAAVETKASHAEKLAARASAGVTKADGSGGGVGAGKISIPKEEYEMLKKAGLSDEKIREHYKNSKK